MKKIVFSLLVCMVLLSTIFLTGCQEAPASPNTKSVILNEVAHSIFYAPLYVAMENGYFSESGIKVELVTGFGADKTMTAVLSGDADIGFMGPETTVYVNQGKSESDVINFAQLTQRAGNFVVSRQEEPDFRWQDLKGKTVLGGRAGGMPEMVFEYILKKNDIDPATDLTIDQSIDFGATAAAFHGGKGDYSVEFEPSATALENMNMGYSVVASLGVDSGFVPYTCFCAKKSYVNSNAEIILNFTKSLQRALNYVNSHSSEEISAVIKPQFKETEDATICQIVNRYKEQDTWKTDLIFTEDSYMLLLNILQDAGQITDQPSYETLIDTSFAKEALAETSAAPN